jgi:hypothetical protein
VTAYPLNWSAWMDLAALVTTREVLDALQLPEHWAQQLFRAHVMLELQVHSHVEVSHAPPFVTIDHRMVHPSTDGTRGRAAV